MPGTVVASGDKGWGRGWGKKSLIVDFKEFIV